VASAPLPTEGGCEAALFAARSPRGCGALAAALPELAAWQAAALGDNASATRQSTGADPRDPMNRSTLPLILALAAGWAVLGAAPAWAQTATVYRCPGPPVLYTDALRAEEARERGCRTIEGAPITVIQGNRPRPAAAGASKGGSASAPGGGDSRVDPAAQRQRDADARRILEAELRSEEDKLAALKRDFNNGEPERHGDERNFQNYLDRVAQMKAAINRSESDIAALKRELGKLAP